MAAYQLTRSGVAASAQPVTRESDGAFIPNDVRNADYQQYLAWLNAGSTPDAAPAPSAAEAAQATYTAAIAAGLTLTWSISTTLNSTYALDQTTQFNMTAETVSILTSGTFTNGQPMRNWPNAAGAFQSFTLAQFKALASAIALYLDGLASALAAASAGGAASWPSVTVTVNA